MNNKLLSYEELKKELKHLEEKQKRYKSYTKWVKIPSHYKYVIRGKEKINYILSAIHHAKQARKLYEYKRLYDTNRMRGLCTENYKGD